MRLRLSLIATVTMALLTVASCESSAQFGHRSRYTSPLEHAENTIGGHKIAIDYYAPSTHGRKVFGGLVPFDTVWCTGANYATKTFD